ncbi:MAG: hypothetical protein ABIH41_07180 [Nanoarchaeota archaeon]
MSTILDDFKDAERKANAIVETARRAGAESITAARNDAQREHEKGLERAQHEHAMRIVNQETIYKKVLDDDLASYEQELAEMTRQARRQRQKALTSLADALEDGGGDA